MAAYPDSISMSSKKTLVLEYHLALDQPSRTNYFGTTGAALEAEPWVVHR